MIFATDLDRTMIYSKKFVNKENLDSLSMFPDGSITNFMTKKAYKILTELKTEITVIPCTTRSISQFKRVSQFKDCEYAICDNGARILHNGRPNKQWEFVVNKNMEFCTAELLKLQDKIKGKSFVENEVKFVDFYFIFFKTNNAIECREWLEKNIDKNKFYYQISGKKCYVFPNFMTKESALKYLVDLLDDSDLITSGDSQLDFGILNMATKGAYLPLNDCHDFDFRFNLAENVTILNNMGINGGEYILCQVKNILEKESETND